jgi:hypothetical protein
LGGRSPSPTRPARPRDEWKSGSQSPGDGLTYLLPLPRRDAVPPQPHITPYVSSFNGFTIPNFFRLGDQGSVTPEYPASIDGYGTGASNASYTILEPNSLVGSNLEFMNATLQPVYTLELDILQPDTGAIGGKIVL